ncbi:Crp/Fnr family transcriptional regulator [Sinorhizobium sp. BG8]|uniref:Crp/Fnr family transcriptional regulator n=1 Tax=Sinorhizobium sp. BG8 TaxID=2613773 RepID=UPI00193EB5C1|nr:Crp/Fnr family transcriptional regulator [Sinorhizobium sp. BG8]QRM56500.1 Crp/Fnr family transcriptional regulator [Sinorhizobium sp. BG8]
MNRHLRPTPRDADLLVNCNVLSRLDGPSLTSMMEIVSIGKLAPRQMLFREGDPAETLYCILTGYVRVFKANPDGRGADVALYGPGELIGPSAAFGDASYSASAQAAETATVAGFNLKRVRDIASHHPDVAVALLGTLSSQLSASYACVANDRLHTAVQRVARYLLENCGHDGKATTFRLPYPKSLLAGKLGLAPEALSRAFAALRPCHVTVRGRQVQIGDPRSLAQF